MARKSSGKYSRAICDRSGFEYPWREMVVEPGTKYFVHKSESDGMWNLVDHPQNYPPRKKGDSFGLSHARPPYYDYNLLVYEGNIGNGKQVVTVDGFEPIVFDLVEGESQEPPNPICE